jgi:hypothetical protein
LGRGAVQRGARVGDLLIELHHQPILRLVLRQQRGSFVLQLNQHGVEPFRRVLIWNPPSLRRDAWVQLRELLPKHAQFARVGGAQAFGILERSFPVPLACAC